MLSSTLLLVATAFTGMVSAQNYSTSGPLKIDPDTQPRTLRQQWCVAEKSNCPGICGATPTNNTCDPITLDYACECPNNFMPNISNYMNTIPYYVCEAWITLCVNDHPNDRDGIYGCRSVTCGTQTAPVFNSSTSGDGPTITSAAPTSTPTGTTDTTSSTAAASSSTTPNAAVTIGSSYGSGILAAGLLAAFGLAL